MLKASDVLVSLKGVLRIIEK